MVQIAINTKDSFTVKLENLQTEVSGYHLTPDLAAEIGFEKITGRADAIEKTRFLEKAGDWSVYLIQWETKIETGEFPAVRCEARYTRVYVRRLQAPGSGSSSRPARARSFVSVAE